MWHSWNAHQLCCHKRNPNLFGKVMFFFSGFERSILFWTIPPMPVCLRRSWRHRSKAVAIGWRGLRRCWRCCKHWWSGFLSEAYLNAVGACNQQVVVVRWLWWGGGGGCQVLPIILIMMLILIENINPGELHDLPQRLRAVACIQHGWDCLHHIDAHQQMAGLGCLHHIDAHQWHCSDGMVGLPTSHRCTARHCSDGMVGLPTSHRCTTRHSSDGMWGCLHHMDGYACSHPLELHVKLT